MAKEDKETVGVEAVEVDHQAEMAKTIKEVINGACQRTGGLRIFIGMRTDATGHRQVSEEKTFGPNSLEDVIVRADFTFVLVMKGSRYWLQARNANCLAIQQIRSCIASPNVFDFPPGMAFSTSQPQTVQ